MTAQVVDIQVLEDLIRKVVREELQNIVAASEPTSDVMSEAQFKASAAKIFRKHKKVFDALA